jgi:hypothetical protein
MAAFKQFLAEMKFTEVMPKGFKEFHDKYKTKQFKDEHLFVNFSNHIGNVDDKTSYANPDHHDPQGTYGYPLKYVIDHPSDLMYGVSAKFLRVLQPSSNANILWLQHMMPNQQRKMFNQFFHKIEMETAIKAMRTHRNLENDNSAWFSCMQLPETEMDTLISWYKTKKQNRERIDLKILSAGEQTKRFRMFDIDAILDTASNLKKAIINDREPEQIVFLHRGAFKTVEVFNLRDVKETRGESITNISSAHEQETCRKIAAEVALRIGEKLLSTAPMTNNMGGYNVFFTKSGQLIWVDMQNSAEREGLKMGQKKHKEFKKNDRHEVAIRVTGKKQKVEGKFGIDYSIEEMANIIKRYYEMADDVETFTPFHSAKEYTDHQAKLSSLAAKKRARAEYMAAGTEKIKEGVEKFYHAFGVTPDNLATEADVLWVFKNIQMALPFYFDSKESVQDEALQQESYLRNIGTKIARNFVMSLADELPARMDLPQLEKVLDKIRVMAKDWDESTLRRIKHLAFSGGMSSTPNYSYPEHVVDLLTREKLI